MAHRNSSELKQKLAQRNIRIQDLDRLPFCSRFSNRTSPIESAERRPCRQGHHPTRHDVPQFRHEMNKNIGAASLIDLPCLVKQGLGLHVGLKRDRRPKSAGALTVAALAYL